MELTDVIKLLQQVAEKQQPKKEYVRVEKDKLTKVLNEYKELKNKPIKKEEVEEDKATIDLDEFLKTTVVKEPEEKKPAVDGVAGDILNELLGGVKDGSK